jgi:hypothetical protein
MSFQDLSIPPVRPIAVDFKNAPKYVVGLKEPTLRLWARLGWLKTSRLGRRRMILLEELQRLVENGLPSRPKTQSEEKRLKDKQAVAV